MVLATATPSATSRGRRWGPTTVSSTLRSERSGAGEGHVYTIVYEARDASGNATVRTATVVVPKSMR